MSFDQAHAETLKELGRIQAELETVKRERDELRAQLAAAMVKRAPRKRATLLSPLLEELRELAACPHCVPATIRTPAVRCVAHRDAGGDS